MGDILFFVYEDYEQMSRQAAETIGRAVAKNNKLKLCAATGDTPKRCYELLSKQNEAYNHITLIMLDEWGEVPESNPVSCAHFLKQKLVDPLGLEHVVAFDTRNQVESELDKMDDYLFENGPIDLCVLGIGTNGHLGFNEPAEFLEPRAHKVMLAKESLNHSMIVDLNPKPSYGITLGMAQILQSKSIILLVNGPHKRTIMKTFMNQQITPQIPASFLWTHPNVTVFCDREAYPTN